MIASPDLTTVVILVYIFLNGLAGMRCTHLTVMLNNWAINIWLILLFIPSFPQWKNFFRRATAHGRGKASERGST